MDEKFRRQLREAAEQWWKEGLIDATLYEKLADRYRFDRLEREASNRFITILISLGAVLVGLGAITFVAANWQALSRSMQSALMLSCFIGVSAAGFYVWRSGKQRLGESLLLLAGLLLGANLALMSQIFHQSGELYELFLVWSFGVTAMAYSLRLTSLAGMALILLSIGFWSSLLSWLNWQEFGWSSLIIRHLPLIVSAVFVPLAYWCRSRVIFALSAVSIVASLLINLRPLMLWSASPLGAGFVLVAAFVLPPALLWSYRDRFWQRQSEALSENAPFQVVARGLALGFLGGMFYLLSFHWWWITPLPNAGQAAGFGDWSSATMVDAIVLGVLALVNWSQLGGFRQPTVLTINSRTIASLLVLTAGLLLGRMSLLPVSGVLPLVFNGMLFFLAIGLIRDGLAIGQRPLFWGGMALLVLGIVSRVFEYDTGLLLKSIVLVVCGVGVIVAGLRFERMTKPHAPLPS
ncbi:DUF2157 domain-containing protein [Leptolyngbya sp. FACHB-36]|uniref:DUF2157 domain-containing protein n=1 Tax=Leptolyngbya sp. FACHB-36 TaxID=2692808 RepID=UPI001681899B|nr:DUF2157 domain-containing protein [Leptolyngbya sp. FACHB-36]MBD2021820.1 DUF2157 domain-containing protein [Leptolyngbya sp. FACHB-36]